MTWKDLGITKAAGLEGDTPLEALFHALGSKGSNVDYTNLLICDAQTNSLKTSAWALHTNIISDARRNKATPATKLAYLNNLDQSLVPYLNSPEAQASLKHGYEVQQKIWKALDGSTKVTRPGTSATLASLHKTWYQRYFEEFDNNLQAFVKAKIDKEATAWAGGSGAYGLYKSVQRNKITQNLKGRSSAVTNLVTIVAWIT